MVIITYTIIIFLLAGIFALASFPIHTVHITVLSNDFPQSGISISWDENQLKTGEDGTTQIYSIKAGKDHLLSVDLPGFNPHTVTVNVPWWRLKHIEKVAFGDRDEIPTAKPEPVTVGGIRVRSTFRGEALNGAEIFIDGEAQNKTTPATLIGIPQGAHLIKLVLTLDDYIYEGEKELSIEAGRTTDMEMELKLVGQLCKLLIRSEPTGASIFIDDKAFGTTESTVKLPPGTYRLRLEKSGYETYQKEINVKEHQDMITVSMTIK